MYICHQNNTA